MEYPFWGLFEWPFQGLNCPDLVDISSFSELPTFSGTAIATEKKGKELVRYFMLNVLNAKQNAVYLTHPGVYIKYHSK